MKIDINRITPRQKLTIAKGLCDYQYIMEHWKDDDEDFRAVYYEFYLKARWAVMTKGENSNPYFDKLQSISGDDNLIDIVKSLKEEIGNQSYEFSLTSKLLHTRNPNSPIYDSKVREYLVNNERVELWWQVKGSPRVDMLSKIEHDWSAINGWYKGFLKSDRAKEWILWFDKNFEAFSTISDVKKIDFIIFATN